MRFLSLVILLVLSGVSFGQRDLSRYNVDARMSTHVVYGPNVSYSISRNYYGRYVPNYYPVTRVVTVQGGVQLFNQSGIAVTNRGIGYYYYPRYGTLYVRRPAYVGVIAPWPTQ